MNSQPLKVNLEYFFCAFSECCPFFLGGFLEASLRIILMLEVEFCPSSWSASPLGKSFASSKISSRLLARVMNTHGAGWLLGGRGLYLLMVGSEIRRSFTSWGLGVYPIYLQGFIYTSQVVVWDFWNINSMMSGGGKIWRLTWALGDIICWMFSDAIRRRLFYFQGVSMSLSKKGWSRVDSFSNESTVETEPSFTQKRSWRDRGDVW